MNVPNTNLDPEKEARHYVVLAEYLENSHEEIQREHAQAIKNMLEHPIVASMYSSIRASDDGAALIDKFSTVNLDGSVVSDQSSSFPAFEEDLTNEQEDEVQEDIGFTQTDAEHDEGALELEVAKKRFATAVKTFKDGQKRILEDKDRIKLVCEQVKRKAERTETLCQKVKAMLEEGRSGEVVDLVREFVKLK